MLEGGFGKVIFVDLGENFSSFCVLRVDYQR